LLLLKIVNNFKENSIKNACFLNYYQKIKEKQVLFLMNFIRLSVFTNQNNINQTKFKLIKQ